jgi:hypothetical protein
VQSVSDERQTHAEPEHIRVGAQVVAQPPQLSGSVAVSTHVPVEPPQSVLPIAHPQVPPEQL